MAGQVGTAASDYKVDHTCEPNQISSPRHPQVSSPRNRVHYSSSQTIPSLNTVEFMGPERQLRSSIRLSSQRAKRVAVSSCDGCRFRKLKVSPYSHASK